MKTLKILNEKVFKAGYVLRKELIETPCKGEPPMEWTQAYNPSGKYIGSSKDAYHICVKRGIQPTTISPDRNVCSIGFSNKNGKWYGWSHRVICGFKIGSTCKKTDCHYLPKSRGGRGEWTAKTIEDAKQMAIDFANGVS